MSGLLNTTQTVLLVCIRISGALFPQFPGLKSVFLLEVLANLKKQ